MTTILSEALNGALALLFTVALLYQAPPAQPRATCNVPVGQVMFACSDTALAFAWREV